MSIIEKKNVRRTPPREGELSLADIKALSPGRHRVARNLWIAIGDAGDGDNRRSWIFKFTSPGTGRPREMGLGAADVVSLARAKELVLRHRLAVIEGRDPLDERRAVRPERVRMPTLREVGEFYLTAHETSWRNPKHRAQWRSTLETYAYPILGDIAADKIDVAQVMRVLEGLWHTKPETASRLRGRIEALLNFAAARSWRHGDNPARWRGHLEQLLPHRNKVRPIKHQAALPWRDLPALWAELDDRGDVSALALKFNLLTVTRTNETIGARWTEIDLAEKVWTVPAERMKAARAFRVPLGAAAVAVLGQLAAIRQNDLIFPGAIGGRAISNMSMLMALRRLRGAGLTVHGTVRSGFRDWASEHRAPGEVAEMALAHIVANKTEAAYRRGDLLEPRRAVLARWARFLTTPAGADAGEIIALRREGQAAG